MSAGSSTTRLPEETDVLIVGASMAGSCLARQLSLQLPDMKVTVIDLQEEFGSSVGESTVEVFDDYAIRNLRLGPYLAKKHITKHGLRFWFDSADRDLPLSKMSEQGRSRYTALNRGIQLNRKEFDHDFCEINRKAGVNVHLGVRVLHGNEVEGGNAYEIHSDKAHLVHTSEGDIRCTYLVDAGGRQSPLALQLDLLDKDHTNHSKGAYWGRFEGTRPIDELGDDSWRSRVDDTQRWASTNHFMYDGYWICLRPLTEQTVSIGVVFDRELHPFKFDNGEELTHFLRQHKALSELLGDQGKAIGFHRLQRITRGVTQFYSTDRWFLSGVSGLFVDPLFSTACGHIALANHLICAMIQSNEQEQAQLFKQQVTLFNEVMQHVFLRQLDSFSNYHLFGSFDTFVNWQTLRYHTVLNYEVPMQRADYAPLLQSAERGEELLQHEWTASQQLGIASDKLAKEFTDFLDERGQYYARNCGWYHEKTERDTTREKCLHPDFGEKENAESRLNWEAYYRYYLVRMCDIDGVVFDEGIFQRQFDADWRSGQSLDEIFRAMRAGEGAGQIGDAPTWDIKGPINAPIKPEDEWWHRFIDPDGRSIYAYLMAKSEK
ncbi:MAG: hypothetical protein AAF699_22040 [Pseudomonadota bacterium]